jgi:hypothetical protein
VEGFYKVLADLLAEGIALADESNAAVVKKGIFPVSGFVYEVVGDKEVAHLDFGLQEPRTGPGNDPFYPALFQGPDIRAIIYEGSGQIISVLSVPGQKKKVKLFGLKGVDGGACAERGVDGPGV